MNEAGLNISVDSSPVKFLLLPIQICLLSSAVSPSSNYSPPPHILLIVFFPSGIIGDREHTVMSYLKIRDN
jgi:hypothetical protein